MTGSKKRNIWNKVFDNNSPRGSDGGRFKEPPQEDGSKQFHVDMVDFKNMVDTDPCLQKRQSAVRRASAKKINLQTNATE